MKYTLYINERHNFAELTDAEGNIVQTHPEKLRRAVNAICGIVNHNPQRYRLIALAEFTVDEDASPFAEIGRIEVSLSPHSASQDELSQALGELVR